MKNQRFRGTVTELMWISHTHIRLLPVTIPNSHGNKGNSQKPICRQKQPEFCTCLSRRTEWPWTLISGSSKPQLSVDFPPQLCRDTVLLLVVHLPLQPCWATLLHPKWACNLQVWGKKPFPKGVLPGSGGADSLLDSALGGGSSTWLLSQEEQRCDGIWSVTI